MAHLPKEWLTEGLIDFEYKKYILLAYLQQVDQAFQDTKLYPHLSDLVFHYQNLVSLRDHKKMMVDLFPKEISKADFEKLSFEYKKMVEDSELIQKLEDIILFAIPAFKKALEQGKDLYEYVEEHLEISAVGLESLYKEEGYVFLKEAHSKETQIYLYQVSIFNNVEEKYRGVHWQHVETIRKHIGETYENLKLQLIKKHKQLPNPSTFLIDVKVPCPLDATLLPIAKRLLVKHIYTEAA
ncbi:MAG: hypothetical protein ACFB0B_01395 [Thermonemataceae bacterium]